LAYISIRYILHPGSAEVPPLPVDHRLISEKILRGSQWGETTNILILFELCPELHIMFVNLKDTF